ncbi:glycosyltransferase [Adhaeribacter sp. BT258]|uniref:Glycosyltransferase n=1 Tax=Adhaeribacter terrigena TaxID=2793070 RepID=A0ABS1BXS5_9BACT|nr:glycosyltransferase [Adhaeribacter terrigena]MBK0401904.1 glycosyltransferase [Adhaeribacter terrigena]
MPSVTVLMPVYNAEKFLVEAMQSMLNQTFRDFEFIIIDDGSTDRSVEIVKTFGDPRIRFYQNEKNMGITKTLNKGIGLAQTEIIARMDADDISYPERLEKQYAYLQQNPDCAMVSCLVRVISEDKTFIRQDRFKSEHFYYNLTFICWIYHPSIMFRKSASESVHNYTVAYAEDYELFWQLTRRYKFYNLPEVLLDYRETSQSLNQVLKKTEYELAQQEQVLRNIRYYAGEHYIVPDCYLFCYRHNFGPILARNSINALVACIKELDFISLCIQAKPNVNRNAKAIKKAALHKRNYTIWSLAGKLPFFSRFLFLLQVYSLSDGLKSLRAFIREQLVMRKLKPAFTFSR